MLLLLVFICKYCLISLCNVHCTYKQSYTCAHKITSSIHNSENKSKMLLQLFDSVDGKGFSLQVVQFC